jgi:hypothetical protein
MNESKFKLQIILLIVAPLMVTWQCPGVTVAAEQRCKFECTDPQTVDAQGKQVIDVLVKMMKSLESENYQEFSETLENDASMSDTSTKEMTAGKEAILAKIKSTIAKGQKEGSPLIHFEIRAPFVSVKGDTAVVIFSAFKEYGGRHPYKMRSRCSDVFVLRDGKWLLIHHRTDWKLA